jgi:zinc protease
MNLAFARLSGDANLVNVEAKMIDRVSAEDIRRVATNVFREENSSVLYYRAIRN